MKRLTPFLALLLIFTACSHKYTYSPDHQPSGVGLGYSPKRTALANLSVAPGTNLSRVEHMAGNPVQSAKPESFIPPMTAFRMSGDYANNVAITISPSGELIYFPAPTDISAASKPVDLGNGWWLNRQGIGPNSVFTTYTFEDYAALPKVPSIEELKASVIPGAAVVQMVELPCRTDDPVNCPEIQSFLNNLAK